MWAAHARIIIQLAAVTLAFYSRMLRSNLILMIVAPSNVFAIGPAEAIAGLVRIVTGLAIALLAYRFVQRTPWPRPFRFGFVALHVVAAVTAAVSWFVVSSAIEALVPGWTSDVSAGNRALEMIVIGTFNYGLIAGVSYAIGGSARAARSDAIAARTQLAALRAQLHPHFLFNALHTVVQLIPIDPARATNAAELVADLLRTTLDEQRDEITLRDEWSFVSRYLEIERIRFGDRLVVHAALADELLDECVPAFALQTLVENAVRHGAAPRVAATEVVVVAIATPAELRLTVRNTGDGGPDGSTNTTGTGLARLRERLGVLYGTAATLECASRDDGGYEATLAIPRARGRAA